MASFRLILLMELIAYNTISRLYVASLYKVSTRLVGLCLCSCIVPINVKLATCWPDSNEEVFIPFTVPVN